MKYQIRQMTIDDIPDVIEGEEEAFGASLGYDMLYSELSLNPYAYYFVLDINKKVRGYIGLWIEQDHSEIINFYVSKKYRNNGFGTMILNFAIDLVKASNVPNISLEVRENNTKAIALYEKHGFKYVNKRERYYSNGDNALVLLLEVNK